MNIEKIFSIRLYDGKATIQQSILTFAKAVIAQTDFKIQIHYDQDQFSQSLLKGTCILLMQDDQVCAMSRFSVHPLGQRPEPYTARKAPGSATSPSCPTTAAWAWPACC